MKLVKFEIINKNELKLKPEDEEDLFILSQIIEEGDVIKGKDLRKIKISNDVVKKPFYLELEVEEVVEGVPLRVKGKILNEYEEIPKGSHHSFTIDIGKEFILKKKELNNKILDLIKNKKKKSIKAILIDDEKAEFFELKDKSIEKLKEINYKTGNEESPRDYNKIKKTIEELKWDNFIIAGPGIFKEELAKLLENKKFYIVDVHYLGNEGIKELLKRSELKKIFEDLKLKEEREIFNDFLVKLKKGEKVSYGKKIFELAELGAIEKLYINADLLFKEKDPEKKELIKNLIKKVEENRGEVHLIESDVKKELKGFGNMFAFLRFDVD
jgi:protein pelota